MRVVKERVMLDLKSDDDGSGGAHGRPCVKAQGPFPQKIRTKAVQPESRGNAGGVAGRTAGKRGEGRILQGPWTRLRCLQFILSAVKSG